MLTLEEIIRSFLYDYRKFFKYRDYNGTSLNKEFGFENYEAYLSEYLGFFKNRTSLSDVIAYACCGIFEISRNNTTYLIRHNHQEYFLGQNGQYRGLPIDAGKDVTRRVRERANEIRNASCFEDIFIVIEECRNPKFGQLSIYDATVRIGAFLGIEPEKVYIHTGVKMGVMVLEEKGYTKNQLSNRDFALIDEFPLEMRKMRPIAVENMACERKKQFEQLPHRSG